MTITSSGIKIQKYSPNLGAVITGVDLSKEINRKSANADNLSFRLFYCLGCCKIYFGLI